MSKITLVIPHSAESFERYYELRWRVLRQPFNRPRGSEQDEYDQVSEHRMLVDSQGQAIGVGRIHFNNPDEAQIRFMAIAPEYQGTGQGVTLIHALESAAIHQGAKRVVINCRDNTLGFYQRCGYVLKEEADTATDPMAEHQLVKHIDHKNYIVYRPDWCEALQQRWYHGIPISKAMGIRIFQYTGKKLELRAPLARNINVHDTMFAGSLYTLATLTGWGLIQLQLQEQGLNGDIVLAQANIDYQLPIREHARAVSNLADLEGRFDDLRMGKNARLTLSVALYDGDDFAAIFTGHYVVKAQRT